MRRSIHQQLGEFLRQRRESCSPLDYGFTASRRRTPGLRREEVAEMSGISSDWYARLEQGRESQPSHATMIALAKTLNLNEAERRHLFTLGSAANRGAFDPEQVPDHLAKMISALSTPAYLTGARKDLLCWNDAAVELFRDFSAIPVSKCIFRTKLDTQSTANWTPGPAQSGH